jgi:hypothetical protein
MEGLGMTEGETLYLGLVIGCFVLYGLVLAYVTARQK